MGNETRPDAVAGSGAETETGSPRWSGRSELVMAGIVLALAIYLTVGITTMAVPEGAEAPGPKFFPALLAGGLYALVVLLVVQHLRTPADSDPNDGAGAGAGHPGSNWRALGTVLLAFAGFAVILQPVGWILSAASLFWFVSRALGSRRTYFDLGLALVFACAIQVAFSAGLGLNLPPGLLEGVL